MDRLQRDGATYLARAEADLLTRTGAEVVPG